MKIVYKNTVLDVNLPETLSGYVYFNVLVKNRTQTRIEYVKDTKNLPDGIRVFKTRGECKSFINGQRKKHRIRLK